MFTTGDMSSWAWAFTSCSAWGHLVIHPKNQLWGPHCPQPPRPGDLLDCVTA